MPCDIPGIPESLHKNEKEINQDFSSDNRLYIRIQPKHFIREQVNGNSQISISINALTTNRQSTNRDLYSNAQDVLFNINAQTEVDHFHDWGVISLGLSELTSKKFIHQELGLEIYAFPFHIPEVCMYPHTEILFKDIASNQEMEIKSRTLKAKIKGHYLDILLVEKSCD